MQKQTYAIDFIIAKCLLYGSVPMPYITHMQLHIQDINLQKHFSLQRLFTLLILKLEVRTIEREENERRRETTRVRKEARMTRKQATVVTDRVISRARGCETRRLSIDFLGFLTLSLVKLECSQSETLEF